MELAVAHGKSMYSVAMPADATMLDLKMRLADESNVPVERIKVLGVKRGARVAHDDCRLCDATMAKRLMMLGSASVVTAAASAEADGPLVINDLETQTDGFRAASIGAAQELQIERLGARLRQAVGRRRRPKEGEEKIDPQDVAYTAASRLIGEARAVELLHSLQ